MSNKNEILKLLETNMLTAGDISKKLGIKVNMVCVYLSNLETEKKILNVAENGRKKYLSITPKALLKRLHSIMEKHMDFTQKPAEDEIKTIKIIEEMIK